MIDNNPIEIEAMAFFADGKSAKAHKLQERFLSEVKNAGIDHCSCNEKCKYHGRCVECIIIHRGHGNHLPNCLRNMVNAKLEGLSSLTEHSFKETSLQGKILKDS